MRISHVHTSQYLDIRNASGTGYYLAKALKEQNGEIDFLPDLKIKFKKVLKAKEQFYKALGYRYQPGREIFVAKHYAWQIKKQINAATELVFSPGTIPLAYLETKKPKVFYTDGTFAGMLASSRVYENLCAETIKCGHKIEQAALSNCSLAIYASDWAAQSAIDNYQVSPDKVKVVPFGANIECNRTCEDIRSMIGRRSKKICRLLFMGVNWEQKGGDLALRTAEALNRAGLKTELHIVGIRTLPVKDLPDYAYNHGFVSKASAEGRQKIDKLLGSSHFLILPTKAECFGIVFCEANSFGVPNIATHVGGVPTVIKDDINGRLFPLSATAEEYARYIMDVFNDYDRYETLALSSFGEYQNRLNWKVAGQKIIDLMHTLK